MVKEEFVKSLPKVKVVLGNGFDLHCGLYTKYSDFYCLYWKKYTHIKTLVKEYINSDDDFNELAEGLKDLNVWDVFFAINSSDNPKENMERWCDIESLIKHSLTDTEHELNKKDIVQFISAGSSVNWPMVKRIIEHKSTLEHDSQGFMASFIQFKMNITKWGIGRFYSFLLKELKEFEKAFGEFIYWQLHYGRFEETHFGVINLNNLYIERAKYVLNCLCNLDNASIDTFNFSFIQDEKVMEKVRYINGSFEEPIFGIDSYFEPTNERYIFTKTSRRMESDMNDVNYSFNDEFENIIIFGHSLNEADYSYFFPLFDKLNLLDLSAKGIVVFAYFIWDSDKEEDIKSKLRKDISDMIYKYAIEKGISNPKRTMDSLSVQKRIVTFEIPDFPDNLKYPKTRLDIDWEKVFKEIEMVNL